MEALPLKFVEGIISQLGSSSVPFLQFMCCFDDEKTKLRSRLTVVRARLLDADEEQDPTHTENDWIEKLQHILYEADDLVEEIILYEKADVERRNILCRFFKTTIPFHIRMPLKLKAIRERLADFAAEKDELRPPLQRSGRDGGDRNRNKETRMEPQSYIRSADIIGREKDKEAIKNKLKEDGSNVPIIIAIIGMGGLGKTTLARSVYDDDAEDRIRFDFKMWVWVSQDFDVKRLLIEVIEAATGENCKSKGMDQLQSKLRECLVGKKYLLVLDDIWNTNFGKWNELGNLLKDGAKGSVILATTRERKVASTMGADPKYQYELKGLDEDDCWSLFEQQLRFKIDQMEEKHMFVAIGKKILNKCGGNPLAIKTVGGLLQYSDRKEWLNIENDRLWSPAQVGNILPALKVSYARLPYHLKKCFAYCSLFPRGDGIMKTELTQLWFAQGFVYQHSNNGLLADSADECFNELRNRSFLQDEENDEYGDVTCCKLHDLMYDLAQKVARSEFVIVNQDSVPNISERIIHVSVKVFYNEDTTVADRLNKAGIVPTKVRNLRTLLRSGICSDLKADFYTTFKRLRVLELKCICEDNPNVLNSLRKLIHLRYLDLSGSKMRMLPNSICKLRYLQTLKLNCCLELEELSGDIKKLTSLIHLENRGCVRLKGMPLGIGQLTSIQTLPVFVLGGEGWAGLSELEGLNNLRGDLWIQKLHNARNAISESRKAFYLKDKKHLQELRLDWPMFLGRAGGSDKDVALLESLQPNPHLKGLDISGYGGVKFPSWMDKLRYLQTLNLNFCSELEELLGDIKKLTSLIHLEIIGCDRLKGMPLGIGQLTSIQTLSVFVLGGKGWAGLSELEGLNNLRGDLLIQNLHNARNAISESRKAFYLKDKEHLQTLSLRWEMREDEDRIPDKDVALLESLQPNPHLKRLTIYGYGGVKFPSWMGKSLPNLVEIRLVDCPSCECLPLFGDQLRSLKGLWLTNLSKLEYIRSYVSDSSFPPSSSSSPFNSNILSGAAGFFPALENVSLNSLPKLKEWSIEVIVGDDGGKPKTDSAAATQPKRLLSLNTLSTLEIYDCPELTSMPSFPNIAVRRLDGFNGALLQSMTMAETICPTASSLPSFLTLSKLISLTIANSNDLVSLPQGWLENFTSLDILRITDCAQLESLSRETPQMPKDLKGKALDFPEEDDLQSCRKLRSLELKNLPKLSSLPKGLQHATKLKIEECPGLDLPKGL